MKHLKFLFLFALAITISACGGDDDGSSQDDAPVVSFDVDAVIALPANTDITNMVQFNGQSASTYETTLNLNENLIVGRPESLMASDIFLYTDVVVDDTIEDFELDFDPQSFISEDGFLQFIVPSGEASDYYTSGAGIPSFILRAIDAETSFDKEYKYNLEVTINRSGINYGPYFIDPKIRIKGLN